MYGKGIKIKRYLFSFLFVEFYYSKIQHKKDHTHKIKKKISITVFTWCANLQDLHTILVRSFRSYS